MWPSTSKKNRSAWILPKIKKGDVAQGNNGAKKGQFMGIRGKGPKTKSPVYKFLIPIPTI